MFQITYVCTKKKYKIPTEKWKCSGVLFEHLLHLCCYHVCLQFVEEEEVKKEETVFFNDVTSSKYKVAVRDLGRHYL